MSGVPMEEAKPTPQQGKGFVRLSVRFLFQKFFESARSKSHVLLRLPLCAMFGAVLAAELAMYIWVRLAVLFLEYTLARRREVEGSLHAKRREATTYKEYIRICKDIDALEGRQRWRDDPRSHHYDSALLVSMTRSLRELRSAGNVRELMHTMSYGRNFGGMMNLDLYTKAWGGSKVCIEDYVDEVVACTEMIASHPIDEAKQPVLAQDRRRFFLKARTEFGNTCLLMSGGAMLGLYHLGVIKALLENDILPKYMSGASAGAVIGCFLAARTDDEIRAEVADPTVLSEKFGALGPFWGGRTYQLVKAFTDGVVYDFDNFYKKILFFTRNYTFLEAYKKTGRVLNITCTPAKTSEVKRNPPQMLNYITAPHVPIALAVMASSCVPLLMHPVVIMERVRDEDGAYVQKPGAPKGNYLECPYFPSEDYEDEVKMRDGSFESDIPTHYMARVFDGDFNIVSQVNPHVVPFFFNNTGEAGRPLRSWNSKGGWRGGFLLSLAEMWLKEDMRKNIKVMSSMRLLFDVFGVDWGALWLQESMGDVTITPSINMWEFFNISKNLPDGDHGKDELRRRIRETERKTWNAIPMLMNRMRIQNALEKADRQHNIHNVPVTTLLTPHLGEGADSQHSDAETDEGHEGADH